MVYRLLVILFLLASCQGTKEVFKKEESKTLKESVLTKSKRSGDSLEITLPNIKLKDTTIYTYNRVGTQLITKYDADGSIDVKCIESSVNEMTLAVKELTEQKNEKEKTEDFGVSNVTVLIVVGFLLLVVCIGFIAMFIYIKSIL